MRIQDENGNPSSRPVCPLEGVNLNNLEIKLSTKDLTFVFGGLLAILSTLGGAFMIFFNSVCQPYQTNLQEIRQGLDQIKIELKEINTEYVPRKNRSTTD